MGEAEGLAKAYIVGDEAIEQSRAFDPEAITHDAIYSREGAIAPPYSPAILVKLYEHSNALRPNIDAYAVNIDGFGHRFEPVIDLEKNEAFEEVRTAMHFERLAEAEDGIEDGDAGSTLIPTDDEVEARIKELEYEMKIEKARLLAFFNFATVKDSFISLRKKTRQDLEIQGNAYWEVLRSAHENTPAQFNYVPAFTVRLMPSDLEQIPVKVKVKNTPLTYTEIDIYCRFRRYVQIYEAQKVYFKEFGDPRVVSSKTGRVYESEERMNAAEGEEGAKPATEMMHFAVHTSRTAYGIPRWVGAMLAVVGSRQAEEVNFLYFENKSVPPLAVMVSGGSLSKESVSRLESYVESSLKGRRNFHKIMVIEAIPAEGAKSLDSAASGRMSIELKPLTDAQQKDSLFSKYDERNIDKIGMAFRLPRMLRGDIRDFNRATADAAIGYAESQVFAPERNDFDWWINRHILPEIGIRFWTFASNGPKTRDPMDLSSAIVEMVKGGILTPEEGRDLASAIFNREFAKIDEIWTKVPPELMKAGYRPEGEEPEIAEEDATEDDSKPTPDESQDEPEDLENQAKSHSATVAAAARSLNAIRESLRKTEQEAAAADYNESHDAVNHEGEVITIELPRDEFRGLFDDGK